MKIRSALTSIGLLLATVAFASTDAATNCGATASTAGSGTTASSSSASSASDADNGSVAPAGSAGGGGSAGAGGAPGGMGGGGMGGGGMGGGGEASAPRTPPIAVLDVVLPTADCADLASIDLTTIGGEGSSVTSAEETTSSNITYCAVNGVLETNITFTVLLPKSTWTQRFQFTGCGGLCGTNSISGGSGDSTGELAIAGTDMAGGTDGTFGLVRERRIAFAYRANHWVTVAAKQFIKAYYGQDPKYSYFNGCSDGGREAVMEALRYPEDFDGIIAGAPAFLFTIQNTLHHGWLAKSNTADDGTHPLIGSRLSVLHTAVVDACDELDGVKDGLLSDPRLCKFDPTSIQCESGATNTTACLTAAEVETIVKIYQGPVDDETGEHLTVGEAQYGSELSWQGVFVGSSSTGSLMSESASLAVLRYLAFEEAPGASYTLDDLEFTTDTLDKLKARHPLFDAVSSDLSAFKEAGGKLILYHGWSDPHISPRGTIAFHEALQKTMGESEVESFERLYLLPGVYHCGSGDGFSSFDFLTPMQNWVESNVSPDDVVVSTGSSSTVSRSRPLYPYPYVAKYSGSGDENNATSYTKGSALYTELTASWAGESWFTPYTPLEG